MLNKLDLKNWSADRIVRMLVGILLLASGWGDEIWWIFGIGLFFLYQGIANIGCTGQQCQIPEKEESKP